MANGLLKQQTLVAILLLFLAVFVILDQVSGKCVLINNTQIIKPVCNTTLIQWTPPENGLRVTAGLLAVKYGMNMTACQEFCYTTPTCRSININSAGECYLYSQINATERDPSMKYSTFECCQTKNATCVSTSVPLHKYVSPCSSGRISWNIPLNGLSIQGKVLARKMGLNVSSCQEFCLLEHECKAAVLSNSTECILMGSTGSFINDRLQTVMTYECCVTVNGSWSQWSEYSECKAGDTVQTRKRRCDNPVPSPDGTYCPGSSIEVKECSVVGNWSAWSSYTTVDGKKKRTRTCLNPQANGLKTTCVGPSEEIVDCNNIFEERQIIVDEEGGILRSTNYPNVYSNDECIQWNFVLESGYPVNTTIAFTVLEFSLEQDHKCKYDFFGFTNGQVLVNGLNNPKSRICGNLAADTKLDAYPPELQLQPSIRFKTDSSVTMKGFALRYTLRDGFAKMEKAPTQSWNQRVVIVDYNLRSIISPNYPSAYSNNLKIQWTFFPSVKADNLGVTFYLSHFNLETCNNCDCDYLQFQTAQMTLNGSSTHLTKLCGNYPNSQVDIYPIDVRKKPSLLFETDGIGAHSGFKLHYRLTKLKNGKPIRSFL